MKAAFRGNFLRVPQAGATAACGHGSCALWLPAVLLCCALAVSLPQAAAWAADEVRASVNQGGAEDWPAEQGLHSRTVFLSATAGNALRFPVTHAVLPGATGLSARAQWAACEAERRAGRHGAALDGLWQLLSRPDLPAALRTEALYALSDSLWRLRHSLSPFPSDILLSVTGRALAGDARHRCAPLAFARLGMISLECGRLDEGRAYTLSLLRAFPQAPEVPAALLRLGQAQLRAGRCDEALEAFATVVRSYPHSEALEDATVGLIMALIRLERYKEAAPLVDVALKRWPRCYLRHEGLLRLLAVQQLALGQRQAELASLWLAVNLDPVRSATDGTLHHLAESCAAAGYPAEAAWVRRIMRLNFSADRGAAAASVATQPAAQPADQAGGLFRAH